MCEAQHALDAHERGTRSFATPVAVRELMRQFDTVLTPLSDASGACSGSLELGTFDPRAAGARKRCGILSACLRRRDFHCVMRSTSHAIMPGLTPKKCFSCTAP